MDTPSNQSRNEVQLPTSTANLVVANSLTPRSPSAFRITIFYRPNATESLHNLHSIAEDKLKQVCVVERIRWNTNWA